MPLLLIVIVAVVLIGVGGSVAVIGAQTVRRRDLSTDCNSVLQAALDEYTKTGPVPIRITSGGRTNAEQLALYAKGRDGDVVVDRDSVVTYAKTTLDTPHGIRAPGAGAFDFVVLVNGAAVIPSIDSPASLEYLPLYEQVGAWFEQRGQVWGGRWKSRFPPFGDVFHIEDANWKLQPLAEVMS